LTDSFPPVLDGPEQACAAAEDLDVLGVLHAHDKIHSALGEVCGVIEPPGIVVSAWFEQFAADPYGISVIEGGHLLPNADTDLASHSLAVDLVQVYDESCFFRITVKRGCDFADDLVGRLVRREKAGVMVRRGPCSRGEVRCHADEAGARDEEITGRGDTLDRPDITPGEEPRGQEAEKNNNADRIGEVQKPVPE
jgi:hypothetical protein